MVLAETPPNIDNPPHMFQEFYRTVAAHVSTHIAAALRRSESLPGMPVMGRRRDVATYKTRDNYAVYTCSRRPPRIRVSSAARMSC